MINYSIVNRTVNANLLEINQAKARVAKAKEAGVTPETADVDLANTPMQYRAYAVAQYSDIMTIEKFAKHISEHGCVYSRADISAILYMAVDCLREQLLDGKKIRLGDLGDFSISLVSKGANSAEKFNAGIHITGINVVWECGQEFKNLIADAEFNLVASRAAQAAVLKAVKAGETVVDLSKKDSDDGGDDPSTDPGTSGGSNPPSDGAKTKYQINVVTPNPDYGTVEGGGEYEHGATINLVAEPKSGYKFVSWNDGNTSASRFVQVTEAKTYTATFAVKEAPGSGDDDDLTPPEIGA